MSFCDPTGYLTKYELVRCFRSKVFCSYKVSWEQPSCVLSFVSITLDLFHENTRHNAKSVSRAGFLRRSVEIRSFQRINWDGPPADRFIKSCSAPHSNYVSNKNPCETVFMGNFGVYKMSVNKHDTGFYSRRNLEHL